MKPAQHHLIETHDDVIAHEIFDYWKKHGRAINWWDAAKGITRHLRSKGHLAAANENGKEVI